MMINHKDKFIFVKLSKSASSTITNIFKDFYLDCYFEKTGHHHILDLLNKDNQSYFKFTTVRNPYDRLVSRYFYAKSMPWIHNEGERISKYQFANLSFKEFVLGGADRTPMKTDWLNVDIDENVNSRPHLKKLLDRVGFFDNQIEWIQSGDGKVLVDSVIKVENIQEDFNGVCDKIGIPHQKLSRTNKSKHKHYTEYYDDETKQIVAKKYAKDIEYFNYEFGE
jgi:chondroitin 4-sulfotransferase 11